MNSLAAETIKCLTMPPMKDKLGILTAKFLFPPDFPGFSGHFPREPILPGIVQIMAVLHTAGGARLRLVKSCKFFRPVFPEEELTVRVKAEEEEDGRILYAELVANCEACASMKLHAGSETA
jgi:3-hydroxyacyl-[acyl-carrier-protein] dehydratase